jgi:Tol biopolymer transport system component
MVANPLPPLNPHFTFTRFNAVNSFEAAIANLDTKRWDYFASRSAWPHVAVGGNLFVFVSPNGSSTAGGYPLPGIFSKKLGSVESPTLLTPSNLEAQHPAISPDQSKIIFAGRYLNLGSSTNPDTIPLELFVMDNNGTNLVQLTNEGTGGFTLSTNFTSGADNPCWSPDGKSILYQWTIIDQGSLIRFGALIKRNADGSGPVVMVDSFANPNSLISGYVWPAQPAWAPDGSEIAFAARPPGDSNHHIFTFNAGDNTLKRLTTRIAMYRSPSYSHDGRFIILTSNRNGETGTLPGFALYPIFVMNRYTGEIVSSLGNFANAGYYEFPRFTATEAVLSAMSGKPVDADGNVIVSGSDDRKVSGNANTNNYYREIIPAANASGINLGSLPSWF